MSFITISELPETTLATLSISEFITDWNQRMASAVQEAKASGNAEARGYQYPTEWADPEFCGWGKEFPNALLWLIAMEYNYFSDDYKDRNGVRPRWVSKPKTLAEMRNIRKDYLG